MVDHNEDYVELKVNGDDVLAGIVEIRIKSLAIGITVEDKTLGVLAMIKEGELDWKVVAISKDDQLAT